MIQLENVCKKLGTFELKRRQLYAACGLYLWDCRQKRRRKNYTVTFAFGTVSAGQWTGDDI